MEFISKLEWRKIKKDELPYDRFIMVLGRCDLSDYVMAFARSDGDSGIEFYPTNEEKIMVPWTDNVACLSIEDIEYWAPIPFIPYISFQPERSKREDDSKKACECGSAGICTHTYSCPCSKNIYPNI